MKDLSSSLFERLGRALRWLRERQGKKQYLVADTAGVTKGMLSAYETGRQKPSLETLEKLLTALECNLFDLHNAIQLVNEHPEGMRREPLGSLDFYPTGVPGPRLEIAEPRSGGVSIDVRRLLGLDQPLEEEERRALEEIVGGCHRLVRHLHLSAKERSPSRVD